MLSPGHWVHLCSFRLSSKSVRPFISWLYLACLFPPTHLYQAKEKLNSTPEDNFLPCCCTDFYPPYLCACTAFHQETPCEWWLWAWGNRPHRGEFGNSLTTIPRGPRLCFSAWSLSVSRLHTGLISFGGDRMEEVQWIREVSAWVPCGAQHFPPCSSLSPAGSLAFQPLTKLVGVASPCGGRWVPYKVASHNAETPCIQPAYG